MTDKELLERIKENPSEFSVLFREYYRMIFGYIFRRTADFDITRDIVAETFIKAFQNIRYFNYRGTAIKVWLYRIATNEANGYFRRKKITERHLERITDGSEKFNQYIEDDRKNLETELHKHDQYLSILVQMKTLPVRYQEVLSLRYFEGKTNPEISEILGKKEGTVKSLISRGLEILRRKCNEI